MHPVTQAPHGRHRTLVAHALLLFRAMHPVHLGLRHSRRRHPCQGRVRVAPCPRSPGTECASEWHRQHPCHGGAGSGRRPRATPAIRNPYATEAATDPRCKIAPVARSRVLHRTDVPSTVRLGLIPGGDPAKVTPGSHYRGPGVVLSESLAEPPDRQPGRRPDGVLGSPRHRPRSHLAHRSGRLMERERQ
jgi:hypothetical protein